MTEWLEAFAELGIKTAVVHPDDAYYQETEIPQKMDFLIKYCEFLGETAQKYNMKIAVETLWEKGQLFTKFEDLDYFQKNIPLSNIGFCFDTGHVFGTSDDRCWNNPQKHLEEVFHLINKNVFNFHIHDTDVNSDKHLPLGKGSIDFNRFFNLLKEMKPTFPVTIEISPELKGECINCLNIGKALDILYEPFIKYLKSE